MGHWHEALGEPTIADAILDRLVHNAYRLELRGESLRRAEMAPEGVGDPAPAVRTTPAPESTVSDGPGRPRRRRGDPGHPPETSPSATEAGVPDYPQTTERR